MSSNKRDNFIQAYHTLNIALVKSLVIKSEYAPMAINKALVADNGSSIVNQEDPSSWKYYMNVAGEYHVTDQPMYVISLDTRDRILFSVEELVRHTATAEAYQIGTRYYLALMREFPEQEALINGILYPANKSKAITAPEGSILAYRYSLVEENERTLIIELESYIKRMMSRWYNGTFALTDRLYPAMFFSGLAGLLVLEVLRLRVDRCKTAEVHSFHLREYLASHSGLDRYLPFLSRDQSLYLYRNIKFIQRNAGNTFMFDELVIKILEDRGIPLTDYTIRQLRQEDEKGYPILLARRTPLNKSSSASQDPYLSLDAYYDKEIKAAYGNERFFQVSEGTMTHALATSGSSVTQTKDLESSMVDLTDTVPDTLPDVFMRQWVYMTFSNLYNVVVDFQDPITTEERMLMSRDAIKYMAYLTFKSEGMEFMRLPPLGNVKFRKHPRPLVEELHALIPSDFRYDWLRELAYDLVGSQPVMVECFSVSTFHAMTYKIYEECLRHYFLQASAGDPMHRSVLEAMCNQLFSVAYWDFSDDEPIEDWRERNNLPPYNYTKEQAQKIVKVIFEQATGYKVDESRQLRYIQKALIDLFLEVSSYSIQVIREINDTALFMVGMPQERVVVESSSEEDMLEVRDGERILGITAVGTDNIYLTDDAFQDFIEAVPDNTTSTLQVVSDVENVEVSNRYQDFSFTSPGEVVEAKTQSLDPVTGLWVDDDPSDILEMSFDQAFKFAKFLGETNQ